MTAVEHPRSIVRATPDRAEEALSALLGAGPAAAARFARQAESAKVAIDRIWCVADELGRYRMAVLAVPTLGRTAMLLATHARNSGEAALLGRAVAAASEGCADAADISQALIEPTKPFDIEAFEAGGLKRLATLDYLERPLPRSGVLDAPTPPQGWTIESAADAAALRGDDPHALGNAARDELAAVLEASYQETRDCPGLAGLRRTRDVLDGHFGVGQRLRFWLIARESGAARGVCLMNCSPDGATAELVYLGLAPAARGRGIARVLLAAGLRACSIARVGTVSLAVDSLNEPAKKLYESSGFRRTSSRVALVRSLASAARA